MKIKLETSPHTYPTDQAYADDIRAKMGIDLDIERIRVNPGKRAVAKLCLNSLWGKFGQRTNKTQTEFVSDACRLYEILLDDRLDDIHVLFLTEEMLQVNYKFADSVVANKNNVNIFIAVYTTANARLRLYDKLGDLSENMVYCDTDSVIYTEPVDQKLVEDGELLGEWTDELGQDDHIVKWCSTGPKSYAYRTAKGKRVLKVKGWCLHHSNAEKITADAMEQLIDREITGVTTVDTEIVRDKRTKQLLTKTNCCKTFSFSFDKRVIVDNYDTVPYGFRRD